MASIPFRRELQFEYGVADRLSPLIRRVIAHNPSAFTFHGTGTYIIGEGNVAVIDPGPDDAAHVASIEQAVAGETVSHIVITHTHRDHSPAAAALKASTGAPTYGFGPHGSGRISGGGGDVEEGADWDFKPDVKVNDGDVIAGDGWSLQGVYTPGHTSNHMCFQLVEEKTLFSGDHVMGWSTTIVSPPDGDMRQYMASLKKLLPRDDVRYWPTHGPAIEAPQEFVSALIGHRENREVQILDCVKKDIHTIPEMVQEMYQDVPKHLHPAAARSVLSHIIHMVDDGRLAASGDVAAAGRFTLP